MMDDIKKDIVEVYRKMGGDMDTIPGKETIGILQEVEININELMKMINIIALDEDAPNGKNEKFIDKMKKAEQDRKQYKQEERRKENERLDFLEFQKAQANMQARMNKVVKRVGKGPGMYRSEKPKVQQKVEKKEKDPDTVD